MDLNGIKISIYEANISSDFILGMLVSHISTRLSNSFKCRNGANTRFNLINKQSTKAFQPTQAQQKACMACM